MPSRLRVFANTALAAVAIAAFASCNAQRTPPNVVATDTLQSCGATVTVNFTAGDLDLPHADILHWVQTAADSVATYYGRFPVKSMIVSVSPRADRSGVLNGTTWGGPTPRTRMGIGQHVTVAELNDDWTMTHELIHTAFPDLAENHHWIEEGLAVYIEPIARVQHGTLSQDVVWTDMIKNMPKGQPNPTDHGLDHDHSWASTYWGGALFFLVADVRIREQTHNRLGLQDALRAILNAGSIEIDSTPEAAFAIGDKAVGGRVLQDFYAAVRDAPVQQDLPALWNKLGVHPSPKGTVIYDDKAPDAAIRKAIFAPHPACKAAA